MLLKQSTAFRRWFFVFGYNSTSVLAIGSSISLTPDGLTGLTIAVQIAKDGTSSFSNPAGGATNLTEEGSHQGWYYADFTSGDADTLGPLKYQLTWSGNSQGEQDQVIALDLADTVRLGLTALPNAAAAASGGLIINGTNTAAVVTLGALNLVATGLSVPAISATGDASSHGVVFTGGSTTGDGLHVVASNGYGAYLIGTNDALHLQGTFSVSNAVTFSNTFAISGATTLAGVSTGAISVSAGSGTAVSITGNSTGISVTTSTGPGLSIQGGSGGTAGLSVTGGSGSDGMDVTAGSGGTYGALFTGNTFGASFVGSGSGNGVQSNGLFGSRLSVQKNVAFSSFPFIMYDSSDHITPKTGLTVTPERSIDGTSFASCTNGATEVGSGLYVINLTSADTNGAVLVLKFTAAGADTTFVQVITLP